MSLSALQELLPRGTTLDDDAFGRRHRWLRAVLGAHVPVLVALGVTGDEALPVVGAEVAAVALLAWFAGRVHHRRTAATVAAVGFVAASAALVHLSGGAVESRFHVLAVLGLVALYQDWVPFASTVGLALAAQVAGTALAPEMIVSHAAGQARPWLWAGIHGGAVLAVAALELFLWRAAEDEHRRGARLAGELARAQSQIEARESVSELFVNLARRNQALLDRQIDLIVGMEEREAEPDTLAELFQLDHLATRIRRNAESLLVLSGEEPARRWGRPVALTDVCRAAVAEVEDYRRVDVLVDETIAVAGRAVADLAHLLAELVENGLQFSPPESRVRVTSVVRTDRTCVLTVEDRGIGLTDVDLSSANDLLARAPEVDLRLSKRLGFHVVSRLAARYKLAVKLAPTPGGGTTATIVVPEELLAPLESPAPVAPTAVPRAARPTSPIPTVAGRPLVSAPAPAPAPVAVPAAAPATVPVPVPVPAPAPAPAPAAAPAIVEPAAAGAPGGRRVDAGSPVVGLPRRVPQASLAPELLAPTNGAAAPAARSARPATAPAPARTPEEVRTMLSRFQVAQQRGRAEAGPTAEDR